MEKNYIMHEDEGHAWLAVKRKELEDLGIIDKISSYSYQKGQIVYLEEDRDFGLFVNAIGEKRANNLKMKGSYHKVSPIRNYQRFQM